MRFSLPIVAALFTAAVSAQTLVAPNGYDNVEGNTNNAFPWNRGASSMRIQFVYDSTNFTLAGINYPVLINNLRYRPNAQATTVSWAGGSWPNVRIDMANSPLDYLAVSGTFASNLGANLATVYQGPVTVQAGVGLGTTVVHPWHIDIPLATPFVYDPSLGEDLTIDIYLDGTGWTGTSTQADHVSLVANNPLCSRVYDTTGLTGTTGTVGTYYGAVVEFGYVPASGLYAGFSANVTKGPSPLTVQFTDSSFSSDPGGVIGWAWDFNGDSVVDSNAQNPSFTYTGCGTYNVSLTVFDASHPANTLTRTGYIVTDQLTASFADQVIAPLTVSFTDTSNMPATAWAWDLNGDSIIDSTAQSPAWVYPSNAPVSVTLTATRNCQSSTVTRTIVPEQQVTTNLAANNGGASLWTVYYDLDVLNPSGVDISSFDSISSSVSTPFTVDVYLNVVGYSGNEYNAAPWTLVGTASGTSNATANQPSNSAFATPLHIPTGHYGVGLRYNGIVPRYVTLGAVTTVGNGDLSLTLGSSAATTVAPFTGTTTTVNTPRMWSGTIYYGTHNITGAAGAGWYGPGCAGTSPVSHQTVVSTPQLGGTLSINFDNLPFGLGLLAVGASRVQLDLGFLGAPGCPLWASPDVLGTILGAGTTANFTLAVPVNPALSGQQFYDQCAVFDPTANTLGFVMSDALGWIIGS